MHKVYDIASDALGLILAYFSDHDAAPDVCGVWGLEPIMSVKDPAFVLRKFVSAAERQRVFCPVPETVNKTENIYWRVNAIRRLTLRGLPEEPMGLFFSR